VRQSIEYCISQLAETVGMSVNAYAHLFKEQTAYPPRKYLLRMQVEKACNLLHHREHSIDEIASSCGFTERYYFTRDFSKTMEASAGENKKNSIFGN
jgi:AraC-like DNA-binding protein